MDLRAVFINNLKRYRKENKLSQMTLAEKCGTSASYIGEIEIGKKFPSVEMVQKFADALNIKPYKLFMEENDIYVANLSPQERQRLVEKLQESVEEIISRTGDFV
ncbi:MAG: helix-turn-helix domain-containing protein [Treponema sp.]